MVMVVVEGSQGVSNGGGWSLCGGVSRKWHDLSEILTNTSQAECVGDL